MSRSSARQSLNCFTECLPAPSLHSHCLILGFIPSPLLFFSPAFCWTLSELQLLKSVFWFTLFAVFCPRCSLSVQRLGWRTDDYCDTIFTPHSPRPGECGQCTAGDRWMAPPLPAWKTAPVPGVQEENHGGSSHREHRGHTPHFRPDNESSCRPVTRHRRWYLDMVTVHRAVQTMPTIYTAHCTWQHKVVKILREGIYKGGCVDTFVKTDVYLASCIHSGFLRVFLKKSADCL